MTFRRRGCSRDGQGSDQIDPPASSGGRRAVRGPPVFAERPGEVATRSTFLLVAPPAARRSRGGVRRARGPQVEAMTTGSRLAGVADGLSPRR